MNEELKTIQRQFNDVITYSQTGIVSPNTDDLFARWYEAKRDFIEAFGGKLIVEYPEPITFALTEEERQERINNFCAVVRNCSGAQLSDFIETNSEGFFNNQVMFQYTTEAFKIPKGMKLVKAFKYFERDPETLEKLQSMASMLIQENCVSGKLCLSVHPLDYLSASENNHHWRSCHSLDGDYRSGNLSYMVDSSTVICYLKTKDDEILPNFPEDVPWNSKKWRVWLYMSDDWKVVFAGRQYPFNSMDGMNFVKDVMLPKYGHLGKFQEWMDTTMTSVSNKLNGKTFLTRNPYILIGGYIRPLWQVVVNKSGSLQFNDLISSSTYTPMYAHTSGGDSVFYPDGFTAGPNTTVYVGGGVKCLRCGEKDIDLSGSMMCTDCELVYGDCDDDSIEICPACGERYIYDDGIYIESTDMVICPQCADNCCTHCDICGELMPEQYIHYDERHDRNVCSNCLEWQEEMNYLNAEYERERL